MTSPTVELPQAVCSDPVQATRREWLVTNGLGGFASGTVSGILTRRYHGLLVAALSPPVQRALLVAKLEELAVIDGQRVALGANRWAGGIIEPKGYVHLVRFHLEGTTPTWTYAVGSALIEKRIWMQQGANTTYIGYRLVRAPVPMTLEVRALVNYRDFHAVTRGGPWRMHIEPIPEGLAVRAFDGATPFYLRSEQVTAEPRHEWIEAFELDEEAQRGLETRDDHLLAGQLTATLSPGHLLTIVLSTDAGAALDGKTAYAERRTYEDNLLAHSPADVATPTARQLVLAADQFIVSRTLPGGTESASAIAGYPWFADWGRDAMIALPGLTLACGRPGIAADILRTFGRFVDCGMLPNRFPDDAEAPEYNTVDATLWYFEAVRSYIESTGDRELLVELYPVLTDIVDHHVRGTRFGIGIDAGDGLLCAGEPGTQLTWMDARSGGREVTPRIGKPVEVNALWYNALCSMSDFARFLGREDVYAGLANAARSGFIRFWNEEGHCCFDVIDTARGDDASLRPNQILAVSLHHSPLLADQQRDVVVCCSRHLLTPFGLRSLDPGHPDYVPEYHGPPSVRDAAYHQGTVWAWLIGPFVAAHLRVYRDPRTARSFLRPLLAHLSDHAIGSISEIFDADPPFTPRGAIAQAWSVAEVLRAWRLTADSNA